MVLRSNYEVVVFLQAETSNGQPPLPPYNLGLAETLVSLDATHEFSFMVAF
jgi:hypothetical protein